MNDSKFRIIPFIYQFLMIFGFMSKIRLGPLTSLRLVMLVALIEIILKAGDVRVLFKGVSKKKWRRSLFLLMGCLLITIIHSFELHVKSNAYFEPSELIITIISIVIMGIWSGIQIKTLDRFSLLVVMVGVVQSFSVFLSLFFPPFQSFVIEHFMYEGYMDKVDAAMNLSDLARTPGIGIAWSSGSLILAFCCLNLVVLKIRNKISMLWFGVIYALIMGATALMGRSGLIVELGIIAYYGVLSGKGRNVFALLIITIIGVIVLNRLLSIMDPVVAEATKNWMFAFLDTDAIERTNEGISKGGFPAFSSDFIIGTGVQLGTINGYSFNADSGYIKCYTSVGIIGMICYYAGILYLILSTFFKTMPKDIKRLILVGVIAVFLMEYKEPFIGMIILPWILFTMGLLCNYEIKTFQK